MNNSNEAYDRSAMTVRDGEYIEHETIYMDGLRIINCRIFDCVLIANKGDHFDLVGNRLEQCKQEGDGWPKVFCVIDVQSGTVQFGELPV